MTKGNVIVKQERVKEEKSSSTTTGSKRLLQYFIYHQHIDYSASKKRKTKLTQHFWIPGYK